MQSILRCHCDTLWWDDVKAIICHSEEVTTDGRNVVGLGRVGQRAILIKTNTLRSEGIEDRLNGGAQSRRGYTEDVMIRCFLTVEFAVEKSVFSSQTWGGRMRKGNLCSWWGETYLNDAIEGLSRHDLCLR